MHEGPGMLAIGDTLASWHDFYTLLGTASATMVGLLFVAASVGSGVFSSERRAPLRVFLSASVINFSLILAVSLIVLAPLQNVPFAGAIIAACAMFGLTHSGLAWRDTLRDGLLKSLDLEDRTWYIMLPLFGYLGLAASGVILATGSVLGCATVAGSVGLLLAVGVHNAWDITVWIITRRRE
jgi:hypothetical protein